MANRKYKNITQERKARQRSNSKYKRHAQTAFTFRYHNVNDADVIVWLRSKSNKIDAVRQLIRNDINKSE